MKKLFLPIALLALLATGCTDDDDPVAVVVYPNNAAIEYGSDNVWTGLSSDQPFFIQHLEFSHYAETFSWGLSWKGFTPARVSTTAAQTDWLSHQFQIATGGGTQGTGTPYIVGFWDTQETDATPLADRSCVIRCRASVADAEREFVPISMKVVNTGYTLATMQEGNAFSKKFTSGDYFRLIAHGVHTDGSEATVSFNLATGTDFVTSWTYMDLQALGHVKAIYFTMESSDTGIWGMNTPSFFAIDELTYTAVL